MLDITQMKKTILNDLPEWHYKVLDAVIEMSNDDDGLWSGSLLSYLTGYPITDVTFFDSGRYSILPFDKRERISVDLPKPKGKGIDNHFMQLSPNTKLNYDMINVNNQRNIPFDEYLRKYGMSTFLLVYAIYKDRISLPKKERVLMIILTVDSAYKGYYKYRKNYIENLEYIGLKDELLPVLESHTKEDFEKLAKEIEEVIPQNFFLNKDGYLVFSDNSEEQARAERFLECLSKELGFPIALPKEQFYLVRDLSNNGKQKISKNYDPSHLDKIYCYAVTDRGHFKSTTMDSDIYGNYVL